MYGREWPVARAALSMGGLALLAAVLSGCAKANQPAGTIGHFSTAQEPARLSPTPKLPPTEAPTATPAFAPIADLGVIPPCGPGDVEFLTHSNGAGGEILFDVLLRNRGAFDCYVAGPPPVRIFDDTGARIPAGALPVRATSAESDVVVLRAGAPPLREGFPVPGQAVFRFSWRLVDGGDCSDPSPPAKWLEFDLPGGSLRVDGKDELGTVPFTPCRHQLLVRPFQPVPGGPPEPSVRACGSADLDATMMGAATKSFTLAARIAIRDTSDTACKVGGPDELRLRGQAATAGVRVQDSADAAPIILAPGSQWRASVNSSDLAPSAGQASVYLSWDALCEPGTSQPVDDIVLVLTNGADMTVSLSSTDFVIRLCGPLTVDSIQPGMGQ